MNNQLLYAYKEARRVWSTADQALSAARRQLASGKQYSGASWPWERGAHNVTIQPKRWPLDRETRAWIENTESAGLRFVDYCDQIARRGIDHKGWFTSEDGWTGEVYRGAVWQLPGRDGAARFIAGYVDPNNEGAAYVCLDIVSDGRDHDSAKLSAAFQADSIAEHAAERERTYQEQSSAGIRWRELGGEIAAERRELLELLAEMRAERKARGASGKHICATLRAAVASHLREIATMRKERADLFSNYGETEGFADCY